MLMNNIGEAVHKQVIDAGILPILVKIVKKKVQTFFFLYSWTFADFLHDLMF